MREKVHQKLGGGNSNIFWNFHPENWGRFTHFDEHIFQLGWNHQLDQYKGQGRVYPVHVRVLPWYLLCSLGFLGIIAHKYPLYRAYIGIMFGPEYIQLSPELYLPMFGIKKETWLYFEWSPPWHVVFFFKAQNITLILTHNDHWNGNFYRFTPPATNSKRPWK